MNTVKLSMISGIYAQIVTVVIALMSVPFFLEALGDQKYGEWLVISAIPAYIVASDLGFGYVISNEIFLKSNNLKKDYATILYSTGFLLVCIILLAVCLIIVATLVLTSLNEKTLHLNTLFTLIIWSGLSLFSPFIDIFYKLKGQYYLAILHLNSIRLLEWVLSIVVLMHFKDLFLVALTLLCVKCFFYIFLLISNLKKSKIIKLRLNRFSKKVVRRNLNGSVAYSVFPLSNAISIQGATIIINLILGPVAVVIFNTYRTLCRTTTQILTIVNKAYWPEFTTFYAKGLNTDLLETLSKCKKINILVGTAASIFLVIFGDFIISTWTGSKVNYHNAIFILMVLSVLTTSTWQANWVFLMALNKHVSFSRFYLISSMLFVFILYLLCINFQLYGAAISLIVFELLLFFFSTKSLNSEFNKGSYA